MKERNKPIGFEISISARDDGTVEAVYIYFSHNPVMSTKQIKGDVLLADFDRDGAMVGLEILAPVKFSELVGLVEPSLRMPFENFVRRAAPRDLVQA